MRDRSKTRLLHLKLLFPLILILALPFVAIMTFPAVAAGAPHLTLTPNSGYSDTSIRMYGVNFAPYSQVRIKWQSLLYGDIYTSTASAGIFDLVTNVPDGLAAGNYAITAVDANGNTASATFTLYSVFNDGTHVGIKTAEQFVQWTYSSNSFYCDVWRIYHDSQNNWYSLMDGDYGLYVLRLTYNGTTYVFDLANGAYNAFPKPLVERVTGFGVSPADLSHVQGKIYIYDPSGAVLLTTITVDIAPPSKLESYYTVIFKITAEVQLTDLALYSAYNLNIYQPPNSALYYQEMDGVYQYYGPSHFGSNIPEQYKGVAGFASFSPSSTHHDVDIDYMKILAVASQMREYDFNYRDRNEVHADTFGNVGIGLQWVIGTLNSKASTTVPIIFAASDMAVENYEESIVKGKVSLQESSSTPPTINLATSQAPGTSIIFVSGYGFMPYANVVLRFGGVVIGSFETNNAGMFEGHFIVPTSVTGDYSLTATDKFGLQAATSFNVVELTVQWLINKIDQYHATIINLITDGNGNLGVLINTDSGNIIASLAEINATLTGLIGDSQDVTLAKIDTVLGAVNATVEEINAKIIEIVGNAKGDVLARIDSKVGEMFVKVDQINATLVEIIGNAKGDVLARIDTKVGQTLVKVDQINATLVDIIGDAKGDVLARIDTRVGQTLVKVDQINATLAEIIGDAKGDLLARIDTKVGETLVKVDQINATLVEIIGNAKGDLLARIDTKVGETLVKVNQINATIVEIIGDSTGDVLARIDTRVGETLVKVDQINATLVEIIGNAEGDILARIDTQVGQTLVKADQINATLVDVVGDAKSGVLARIDTKVGEALVKLETINATIVGIVGDAKAGVLARIDTRVGEALVKLDAINGGMSRIEGDIVTIKTDVGELEIRLADIQAKVIEINGTVAKIQTSLGPLIGNITKMEGDMATIKTELGNLKLTTKPLTSQIDLQPFTILAIAEIIALAAIIYAIYMIRMRKRQVAAPPQDKVVAETPL